MGQQRRVELAFGREIPQRLGARCDQRDVVLVELAQKKREAFLFRFAVLPDLGTVDDAFMRLFDQRERIVEESCAVFQNDERCVGHLQRTRRDIVTGARLTDDEDRFACARERLKRALRLVHHCAHAEHRERDPARLFGCSRLERARYRREQLGESDRLLEEIESADARRLDGGLDRAMPRHHDDRHRDEPGCAPFAKQRHSVSVGHPDVEQNQRRLLALPIGARFAGVLGHCDSVTLVLQNFGQQLSDADFVVDDQYFAGRCHANSPVMRQRPLRC
jgi:hypothetical protein